MTNVTLINEELLYINVTVNCINFESMTNVTLINGFEFQIPGGHIGFKRELNASLVSPSSEMLDMFMQPTSVTTILYRFIV